MLKWYCLVSIGIPVFTTALACILQRDQPYLTSRPRKFYCEMADTPVTAGTFALPLLLASVPGMVFSLWTAVVLLQHIRSFRQLLSPPRMSGLHIGHSLRLVVFTIVFAVIIIMTAMERVIYIFSEGPSGEDGEQVSAMSDFSGSVVGVGIFVVFGTTSASLRTIWRLICCKGLRGFDDNSSNGSGGSSSRRSGSTPSRRVSDNNSQDALDDFYAMDGVESDTLDIFDMLRSSPITRPAPVHSPV
ncbi:hypothetical protein BGW41_006191 [Actinomortierella wolfii]|nr:hypothetical protein BGW41_006191 [Actinomortierella wolfii]